MIKMHHMRKRALVFAQRIHYMMWDAQSQCHIKHGSSPSLKKKYSLQAHVSGNICRYQREVFGTCSKIESSEDLRLQQDLRLKGAAKFCCSLFPVSGCSVKGLLPGTLTTLPVPTAISSRSWWQDTLDTQFKINPTQLQLFLAVPLTQSLSVFYAIKESMSFNFPHLLPLC